MDLCAGARRLFLAIGACYQYRGLKIVEDLTYPATAEGKVDMISPTWR